MVKPRENIRIKESLRTRWSGDSCSGEGTVLDISFSGMKIITSIALPEDIELLFTIEAPKTDYMPFGPIETKVKWLKNVQKDKGIRFQYGLEFIKGPHFDQMLRTWLEEKTAMLV